MFLLEFVDFQFLFIVYFYEIFINILNFDKLFYCIFYLRNKIYNNGYIFFVILNI